MVKRKGFYQDLRFKHKHICISLSVHFSRSVVSDSLQPRGPQTPGFPVHHQLPELTQTHVHGLGDATQPPHPLWSSKSDQKPLTMATFKRENIRKLICETPYRLIECVLL